MNKKTISIIAVGIISMIIAVIMFAKPQTTNSVAKANKFADEPKTKAQIWQEAGGTVHSTRVRAIEEGDEVSLSGTRANVNPHLDPEDKLFEGDVEYIKEEDKTEPLVEITVAEEIRENTAKEKIKDKLIEEIKKQKLSNKLKYIEAIPRTFELVGEIENTGLGAKQAQIKVKRSNGTYNQPLVIHFSDTSKLNVVHPINYSDVEETVKVNYTLKSNKVQKTFTVNVGDVDKNNLPQTLNIKLKNGENPIIPEQIKSLDLHSSKTKYESTFELPEADENDLVIDYKYEVEVPQGYKYKADTNTLESNIQKISITVEKTWINGQNAMPEEIRYNIKRKLVGTDEEPVAVGGIRTLTKAVNGPGLVWTAVFEEDKTNSEGILYEYSVEELPIESFNTSYSSEGYKLKITNTYVIPTNAYLDININVVSDKKEKLPAKLIVKQKKNNVLTNPEVKYEVDLNTEKTAYKKHITNLASTEEDGTYIDYSYEVEVPEGYHFDETLSELSHKIVNTKVQGTITFEGGIEIAEDITVKIFRNTTEKIEELTVTKDMVKAGNGVYKIERDLPMNDKLGNEFTYKIKYEDELRDLGFGKDVDGNNVTYIYAEQIGQIQYSINFRNGNPANRPSVLVKLLNTEDEVVQVKKSNKRDIIIFENIKLTNIAGEYIRYKIKVELDPENITEGYNIVTEGTKYIVEYKSPKKDIKVDLEYIGGKDRPNILVELTRAGDSVFRSSHILNGIEKTHTFNEDKTTLAEVDYEYQLVAKPVTDYDLEVVKQGENFIVKATYQKKIGMVTKNVTVATDKITSAEVELVKNGKATGLVKTANIVSKSATVQFADQELTDADGNDNMYSLIVKSITPLASGYVFKTMPTGDANIEYYSPKQRFEVKKEWTGGETKPENIKLTLKRKLKNKPGTLEEVEKLTLDKQDGDIWKKLFDKQYPKFDGNADEYEYSIVAETKDNNNEDYNANIELRDIPVTTKKLAIKVRVLGTIVEPLPEKIRIQLLANDGTKTEHEISYVEGNKAFEGEVEVKENNTEGNPMVYTTSILTEIPGYIKGDDLTFTAINKISLTKEIITERKIAEKLKEESKVVTIVVKSNGTILKSENIDPEELLDGKEEVTFTGLNETNQSGQPIAYQIEMITLPGYTSAEENGKIVIKKLVEKMDKKVVVEYNGGKLRKPVKVQLLKNGAVFDTKEINDEYTFRNLDKNTELADEFEYKLKVLNKEQLEELNYVIEIKDTLENSKIVLKYVSPKIEKIIKLVYQSPNGEKPKFKILLLRNGILFKEVELNGEREYEFKDLDKTDLLGEDYEYTVKIANLSKNYEHQITSNGNVVISKKLGNGSKLPHAGLTKENVALTFLFVAIVVYGNYTMLNMRSKLRRMNKFTK